MSSSCEGHSPDRRSGDGVRTAGHRIHIYNTQRHTGAWEWWNRSEREENGEHSEEKELNWSSVISTLKYYYT